MRVPDADRDDPHRYDDLLDLPRHVSPTRPRMSSRERAAQFAPFAALTGYGSAIEEAQRRTDQRIELGEAERESLDRRMRALAEHLDERPEVSVIHFIPDRLKAGGRYVTALGVVRRLQPELGTLQLEDGMTLELDDIIGVESALFDRLGLT